MERVNKHEESRKLQSRVFPNGECTVLTFEALQRQELDRKHSESSLSESKYRELRRKMD